MSHTPRRCTRMHCLLLWQPRRVRLKLVARVITFAFPISWIFIVYFGYQIVRDELAVSGLFGDLGPYCYSL
jgi:hypothetical protein